MAESCLSDLQMITAPLRYLVNKINICIQNDSKNVVGKERVKRYIELKNDLLILVKLEMLWI